MNKRRKIPYLLVTLGLWHSPSSAYAQDDLFEKVFKKSSENAVNLPIFFEGLFFGEVQGKIRNGQELTSFRKDQFLNNFQENLNEEVIQKIQAIEKEYLSPKDLKPLGLLISLDLKNLYLGVDVELEARRLSSKNLAFNIRPDWAQKAIYPKGLSGFLNLNNFIQDDSDYDFTSYTSDQALNLNWGRFSFLSQSSLQRDNESRFIRQDTRFTFDDPNNLVRYQLGDLNYSVGQFQSFQPGAGIMASTNFGLNPYRLFNPMSFREITLNTPSRVRVFVNNILVQTLNLPKGRHRLDNLPLNEGINNIRLEILDQRGRAEEVEFKGTTSFNLIGDGVHDFTYGGGIPAENNLGNRVYDTDDKKYFFVARHLYGFSNSLNLGFDLSGNSRQRILNLRSLHQGLLGLTTFDMASSQLMRPSVGEESTGLASRLTHVFRNYQGELRRLQTFDFALEYLGPGFAAEGNYNARAGYRVAPEVGYTRFLSDYLNARIRGAYRYNSVARSLNNYTGTLSLSYVFKRNYQFSGQYSFSRFNSGESDQQVLFSFNWSMPETGQVVTASFNTETKDKNGQYSYTGKGRPSNWRLGANVRDNESTQQSEIQVGREDQRVISNLSFQNRDNKGIKDSTLTRLNVNTALVYADGAFGLSRPVTESFLLVDTNGALEDHSIYLNRSGELYEAETGFLNHAVIPTFQGYRYYPVRFDSRDLPFGVTQPPSEVVIAAPFRGGVRLRLDSRLTKALVGKIQYQKNILQLRVGELKSTATAMTYPFFTNRKGRFFIESILPGEYEVIVEGKYLGLLTVPSEGEQIIKWEKNYE